MIWVGAIAAQILGADLSATVTKLCAIIQGARQKLIAALLMPVAACTVRAKAVKNISAIVIYITASKMKHLCVKSALMRLYRPPLVNV